MQVAIFGGNALGRDFYQPLNEHFSESLTSLVEMPLGKNRGLGPAVNAVASGAPELIVGHSLGGLPALWCASIVKNAHLVLLEPAMPPSVGSLRRFAQRYRRECVWQSETFQNESAAVRRVVDVNNYPSRYIEDFVIAHQTREPDEVAKVFCELEARYPSPWNKFEGPTLVVYGAESPWATRLYYRWLARRFVAGRAEALPGAAHWMLHDNTKGLIDLIDVHRSDGSKTGR